METPNNDAGRLTERILLAIREHLAADQPGQPHHYNRAYGRVYEILSSELPTPTQASKTHEWYSYANGMYCRRCGAGAGSGYLCR